MKFIVGLTGGIASGKSYVSKKLIELGYSVIDTDNISRSLYSDKFYLDKIKESFPETFNLGKFDKKKLSKIVFDDTKKLELLNSIAHPIILKKTREEINKYNGIIFIDAPLLFEANFDILCNLVVCVYTKESEQLKRLISRDNIDIKQARKIIDSQMSVNEKKKKSDILLESCEDFSETDKNILEMIERINQYVKSI